MLAKLSRRSVQDECWWRAGGCLDSSLAYIFDEGSLACPFKRVRAVQLQPDTENNLLLDSQLGLLFNVTGTKKLTIEGCPGIYLISTTYEGVFLSMDSKANELEVVKSLNIHQSNLLGPTLEFFHFTNHKLVQSLIRNQKEGDCKSWLRISYHKDHPHPTIKRQGLFTRRVGSLIHKYTCKTIQAPIVELSYCLMGIPVVLRGELHVIDTDSRVISVHLEQQTCETGFPMLVQTAGDSKIWVQISKEVWQVKDPNPLHERIKFQEYEHMLTLYTLEELREWEEFSFFPAMQRSRTQKILNALCVSEQCSSAGNSQTYEKFDLEKLTCEKDRRGNPCQNESLRIYK